VEKSRQINSINGIHAHAEPLRAQRKTDKYYFFIPSAFSASLRENVLELTQPLTKELLMRLLPVLIIALMCISVSAQTTETDQIVNLLKNPPYTDNEMGKKVLVDTNHLLMIQAALKPGQMVPQHDANSNVHILVLDGDVVINLSGKDIPAKKGDLVPIAFKTPMNIKNKSMANATFLIIKTPNPGEIKE
jgi:quercetin dioxygenase-like cupin family protein